jgi:hypothetical protein
VIFCWRQNSSKGSPPTATHDQHFRIAVFTDDITMNMLRINAEGLPKQGAESGRGALVTLYIIRFLSNL